MSLTVVASAKGSPGSTTVAACLAAELARRSGSLYPGACLVDADPDGGDLALALGLEAAPSVGTLALAGRHGFNEAVLVSHAQRSVVIPGVAVVAGVAGRAQRSAVEWVARPLGEVARRASLPVVADAGRVGALESTRALYSLSDHVIVVCGARTASIVHTRSALVALKSEGFSPVVVVIEPVHDAIEEIAAALGQPVIGTFPIVMAGSTSIERTASFQLQKAHKGMPAAARLVSVLLNERPPLASPEIFIEEHAPIGMRVAAHAPASDAPRQP